MVTIKDIARESGYSVSTVSRVLNNRNDVSPDARKKIEEVVAKFNFVPNNNAKHLKQNNSKAIGVLVKGISNMLFASVVEEIQRMIEKTEYTLVVSYLDEDADEVEQAILLCRERKPLGLLFLGGNPEYFHREFSGVDVPCVLVTNRANEMLLRIFPALPRTILQRHAVRWISCLWLDTAESAFSAVILTSLIRVISVSWDVSRAFRSMGRFLMWSTAMRRQDSLLEAPAGR